MNTLQKSSLYLMIRKTATTAQSGYPIIILSITTITYPLAPMYNKDTQKSIFTKFNTEIKTAVAKIDQLRSNIDVIIAEIEE